MKKFILPIFCYLLLISCNSRKSQEKNIASKIIIFPKENMTPTVSEYFELIEPIVLETNSECQIGRIDKLIVKDELIFIQDYHQKTLFIFASDGKYKNKISAIGKGPGEYIKLSDFYIDSENRIIEILEGRKILKYDFSGKFIEVIKLKRPATNFHKTKNGNYYLWVGPQYQDDDSYTLNFADKAGKILNRYYPWDMKGKLVSSTVMFSEYGDNIIFRPFAQDYSIRYLNNHGEITPYYHIDFGEFAVPSVLKEGDKCLTGQVKPEEVLSQNYAHKMGDIFETDEYLIFRLLIGDNMLNNFIYSKKLSKSVNSKSCSKDDVLPPCLLHITAVNGEYLYSSLMPFLWLDYAKPRIEKSGINNDKLMNLARIIKHNDNPIIFKLKVNDSIFK